MTTGTDQLSRSFGMMTVWSHYVVETSNHFGNPLRLLISKGWRVFRVRRFISKRYAFCSTCQVAFHVVHILLDITACQRGCERVGSFFFNPKMTKTRRADCDKLCGFSHDTRRAIIYPDLSIPFISKREGNGTGSYVFPLATLGQDYIPRNILVSECGDASCF